MLLPVTCIAIANKGVLLAGPSGSGKSDLALRLIDQGARLVSDDQTTLRLGNQGLLASAPAALEGLCEIRHVGLIKIPYQSEVPVALYVDLAPMDRVIERLPETHALTLLGQSIMHLTLPAFASSTPAKIRAVLTYPLVTDSL